MWPALIAAGASLIGSKMADDRAEEQQNIQREFAQSGIQWKVADAKAAGVHPLFALGASTASYSPVVSQAPSMIADAGQNISRAALASQTAQAQADVQAAQIRASDASAMKDLAQSQYYASLAARSQQENQSGTAMPPAVPQPIYRQYGSDQLEVRPMRETVIEGQSSGRAGGSRSSGGPQSGFVPPAAGLIEPKAGEQYARSLHNPGLGSEVNPALSRFQLPSGMPMLLPSKPGSEALEAAGEVVSPLLIARENLAHYGLGWAYRFVMGDRAYEAARFLGDEGVESVKYHLRRYIDAARARGARY